MYYDHLLKPVELEFRNRTREFARSVDAELLRRMDRNEIEFPKELFKEMGRRCLLGARFPGKYGGSNLSWVGEAAALEEIGVLGSAATCVYSMPSIVGEALNKFGTDEQKGKYLKPLLAGDVWAAEALTEPRGGSDFFGATCTARLDGNDFILNGHKRFIVGAKGADFFLVYCRTNFDPQAGKYARISLLLVERDRGVEVGSLYGLLGSRGTGTGRVVFKDVRVPRRNLVGGLNEGALIFNTMMVPERFGSVAAIGMARAALEVAVRYTDRRVTFGQKIRKWQGVSFQVADAITKLDAARGLYYIAASHLDAGLDSRRLVSEAKHFATDINWQVCNIAMVIMGGISYTDVYPVEKFVRDARLGQIWTGTENVMRMLIQHEYYNELLSRGDQCRAIEQDATNTLGMNEFEKVYADEDQEKLSNLPPLD
jgi:hypothetical protein